MISQKQTTMLVRAAIVLAVIGTILMASFAISTLKGMNYMGKGEKQVPSISVSGDGDAYAKPDMATLDFSIQAESKDQKVAADNVNTTMKKMIEALKAGGISESDIKTTNYSLNPQYDYVQMPCEPTKSISGMGCIPGKQVLRGYQVNQRIQISVKGQNFDKVANYVDIVTKNGATDIGQLDFKVEHPEKLQAEAREKAIKEAKQKAEVLADQLGVELVRITGFYEGNSNPEYNGRAMLMNAKMDMVAGSAPTIPTGQNQYKSNVSITYEIAE